METEIIDFNSLNIPYEELRKDWTKYNSLISYDSNMFNNIWKDWINKFNIDTNDIFINTFVLNFREFITKDKFIDKTYKRIQCHFNKIDDNTLVIKGLNGEGRKNIHKLCDKIGLHHQSIHVGKKNKHLYIYKPEIWLWEFTIRNPYSENDSVYLQREQIRENRLSKKYCSICNTTGLNTTLFHSVYLSGYYCEDCLDIESDGEGGALSDHKFEPVY